MRGPGPKWLEKHSALAECANRKYLAAVGRTQACRPRSTFERDAVLVLRRLDNELG